MLTITLDENLETRARAAAAARGEDFARFALAAILDAVERQEQAKTHPSKPLSQFIEEQRIKHGFPADWPHSERFTMTDEDWAAGEAVLEEK